jgi:flagellar biosynthesis protein FlhA
MPLGRAFETYAILTVGDGLVTQIPAVVISIATALLLARGGTLGATDAAMVAQIGRHPAALATVAVLMVLFALVPGLPFVPFILGGLVLGGVAAMGYRGRSKAPLAEATTPSAPPPEPSMGDILELDDIHVEFAPDLVNMVLDPGEGLDARIANMRRHVATRYGLILPEIRLTDDAGLEAGSYVIRVHGVEQARAGLRPDNLLALDPASHPALPPGEAVREPVYGAPARWIPGAARDMAALDGATLVTPTEVLATHLLEVIRRNLSRLLTMKAMRRLLDEMVNLSDRARGEANRKLLEEMIPDRIAPDLLHAVLRLLLAEQVSIRNLPLIIEAAAEGRAGGAAPEAVCEHVRQRLGFQLVAELTRPDGTLPLIQLAPEWEERFSTYQIEAERGRIDVALPPDVFNALTGAAAEAVNAAQEKGIAPAIVTSTPRRRFLRTALAAKQIGAPVLSFEEIGTESRPSLVGVVAA